MKAEFEYKLRRMVVGHYYEDVPGTNGFEEKTCELGDIAYDIAYDIAVFNSTRSGFIYGGGLVGGNPRDNEALGVVGAFSQPPVGRRWW